MHRRRRVGPHAIMRITQKRGNLANRSDGVAPADHLLGQLLDAERAHVRVGARQQIPRHAALGVVGHLVPGDLAVRASRDPEDDKYLAAAIEGMAKYLVSGDDDLLTLRVYEGIPIVTARSFAAMTGGAS